MVVYNILGHSAGTLLPGLVMDIRAKAENCEITKTEASQEVRASEEQSNELRRRFKHALHVWLSGHHIARHSACYDFYRRGTRRMPRRMPDPELSHGISAIRKWPVRVKRVLSSTFRLEKLC